MKNFKSRKIIKSELYSIVCDVCNKEYEAKLDFEEIEAFINISRVCSYGSIFGDGIQLEIDICQYCFKEKLGEFCAFRDTSEEDIEQ